MKNLVNKTIQVLASLIKMSNSYCLELLTVFFLLNACQCFYVYYSYKERALIFLPGGILCLVLGLLLGFYLFLILKSKKNKS